MAVDSPSRASLPLPQASSAPLASLLRPPPPPGVRGVNVQQSSQSLDGSPGSDASVDLLPGTNEHDEAIELSRERTKRTTVIAACVTVTVLVFVGAMLYVARLYGPRTSREAYALGGGANGAQLARPARAWHAVDKELDHRREPDLEAGGERADRRAHAHYMHPQHVRP